MAIPTHKLNEAKKRLEPVNSKCIFCGKGHVDNPQDNVYISLYKELKREENLLQKKVTYKHIKVGLTRCPHCKKMHRKEKFKAILCATPITILAIFIAYGFAKEFLSKTGMFFVVGTFGLITPIISYFLIYHRFEKKLYETEHILPQRDAAMQYDIVKELLDNGWSFNAPVA